MINVRCRMITYECCPGYERVAGEKGCPAGLIFKVILHIIYTLLDIRKTWCILLKAVTE